MSTILSKEDIDFVVMNGDLVSGERAEREDSGKHIPNVVSPLVDGGYRWASTYGNHDSAVNFDPKKDMYEAEHNYNNSLTQSLVSGDKAGVTNYYLPVFSHGDSNKTTPALLLWFFDSKGGQYYQKEGKEGPAVNRPTWIDESVRIIYHACISWQMILTKPQVVDWFTKTNQKLRKEYGKAVPSLAFYHIPIHAALLAQERGRLHPHRTPGANRESVHPQGTGPFEYESQDVKFMEALLKTEGLIAGFSGHDHMNDWCFKWDDELVDHNLGGNGVCMCYGRHTGYGGYGDLTRGSRQILLNQTNLANGTQTWIRLEDGSVQAQVTLNTTYGQDQYPIVANAGRLSAQNDVSLLSFSLLWFSIMMIWRWKI